MSKSDVLYMKGMNVSDSDDEDQWDDRKLNEAYDKAVRIANIEVAKRVAMSTNTPTPGNDPKILSKKEKISTKSSMKKVSEVPNAMTIDDSPKTGVWKPNMPCRLIFSEDGLEYEAVIVGMVDNDECVVKYIGYENQEVVSIEMLMPSRGMEARARQIIEATTEQADGSNNTLDPLRGAEQEYSDQMPGDNMGMTSPKKKKSSKKKKNQSRNMNINGFEFPAIPPMPNLSMLRNQLGATAMPMPPPPMAFASSLDRTDSEDQAISSMLLSWYMSGYYTGLYQGMKRAKDARGN